MSARGEISSEITGQNCESDISSRQIKNVKRETMISSITILYLACDTHIRDEKNATICALIEADIKRCGVTLNFVVSISCYIMRFDLNCINSRTVLLHGGAFPRASADFIRASSRPKNFFENIENPVHALP